MYITSFAYNSLSGDTNLMEKSWIETFLIMPFVEDQGLLIFVYCYSVLEDWGQFLWKKFHDINKTYNTENLTLEDAIKDKLEARKLKQLKESVALNTWCSYPSRDNLFCYCLIWV